MLTGGSLSATGGNSHHLHGISTGNVKHRAGSVQGQSGLKGLGLLCFGLDVVTVGSGLQ